MNRPSHPLCNRLLLALPASDLDRLMPELSQIKADRERVLVDIDQPLNQVFFPNNGVVSVVAVYEDGGVIEMATIGREGCTGVQATLGAAASSVRFLVQVSGDMTIMSRTSFVESISSTPAFRELMYEYAQAFLEQVLVSAACNNAHNLKQRLARWLLTMRDRQDNDTIAITQRLLAEMLGVHKPSTSRGLAEFEALGAIARSRGSVIIVDRQGLENASCECYRLVRSRIASHLPKTFPRA